MIMAMLAPESMELAVYKSELERFDMRSYRPVFWDLHVLVIAI